MQIKILSQILTPFPFSGNWLARSGWINYLPIWATVSSKAIQKTRGECFIMPLTDKAIKRLAGQWGGYDFSLIRDKHFVTVSELVERFLEKNEPYWIQSSEPIDREFIEKPNAVRRVLQGWSTNKIQRIHEEDSPDTLRSHIMFKQLHYGDNQSMNFGSIGTNWKKKKEIADELALYRP